MMNCATISVNDKKLMMLLLATVLLGSLCLPVLATVELFPVTAKKKKAAAKAQNSLQREQLSKK